MGMCIKACLSLSTILGIAMVVIGAVMFASVFPKIVVSKIDQNLVLKNDSEALERFENPDVPSYMKFYFFNVTNKDEVNDKGAKAVLKEMGPYVYRKEITRVIQAWNNTIGTITYYENTTYYFEPSMSTGSLQDLINHVNMVSVSLIISKDLNLLERLSHTNKSEMIENAPGNLVESHTVDELLFRGFDIRKYLPPFNTTFIKVSDVCYFQDNCTYAFFLKKNESYSKPFEVKTGLPPSNISENIEDSMKHYREIVGYNGERILDIWSGPTCNTLNGTDGTQYHPVVDRNEELYIFVTEVCRSLNLQYEQDQTTSGINGLRFVIPSHEYAAPTKNKNNWCFFPKDTSQNQEERQSDGVLPVSSCYDEHPVLASAPHFYMGDRKYVDDFVGLHPQKGLHESFLDVEQMTGTTIKAAKRIQINIEVVPDSRPKFLKFINKTLVFPVFWAEESGEIDDKNVKLLNHQLMTPYNIGKWSLLAIIVIGSIILAVVFVALVMMYMSKNRGSARNFGEEITRVGEKNYNSTLNSMNRMKDQVDPAGEK